MENMLNNVKTLIPLIAAILALAGFYYTTQHRLDHLENEISELREANKKIKKSISKKKDSR